jgi:hypothetical protein
MSMSDISTATGQTVTTSTSPPSYWSTINQYLDVFKSVEFEVQLGMLAILGLVIYLFYRYKSASLTGKRPPLSSDETAIAIQAMTAVSTAASNSADATMRLTAEIKDHVESMNAIQRTLIENHAQSENHMDRMSNKIDKLASAVDALARGMKPVD